MGMEANFDLQLNSATRCYSIPPRGRGRGHDSKWKRQRRYAVAVAAAAVQQVATERGGRAGGSELSGGGGGGGVTWRALDATDGDEGGGKGSLVELLAALKTVHT